MSRKVKGREGQSRGITRTYEGPEVLSALLARAGCPLSAGEVASRFSAAQAEGRDRSEVIPSLFEAEPRFDSPDDARRLYGNLFGLWERVEGGQGVAVAAAAPVAATTPTPSSPLPPPLPERGALSGDRLTPDLVEAVWKHLASLPERELRRRRDRFAHAQPDLVAWLDDVPLPASGGLAAQDLGFETWAMFDQAFGERLQAAPFRELESLASEPPPLESEQPALAVYVAEMLENLSDEDAAFNDSARAQVERALATVATALTRAIRAEER
jgi:hypothetical protein